MEQQNPQPGPQQIQVKASDEVLKGQYATMAQVSSSSEEFILDFFSLMPPAPQMAARIIVSPSHFKRITKAMEETLKKYEEQFGVIQLQVVPDNSIRFKTE